MYLVCGSYPTPPSSSWFTLSFRAIIAQTGRKIAELQRWSIHTVIQGTSQANLTSLIAAHETGMRQNNVDLTFYQDDGTATAHKVVNSQTSNGLVFKGISYPGYLPGLWGFGNEYQAGSTLRYVVTQHEAEVFDVENNIVFLWHSMRSSLAGFNYAVPGAFTGAPQFQITMQQAPCWAMQRGTAIGMFSNPIPPGPLVSVPPMPLRSWVEEASPKTFGRVQNWGFPTTWNYYFEAPGSLRATPTFAI